MTQRVIGLTPQRWVLLALVLGSGACSFHPFPAHPRIGERDPGEDPGSDRTSLSGWTISGTTDRPVTASLEALTDADADPASFAFTVALGSDGLAEDSGASGAAISWSGVLVLEGDEAIEQILEVTLDP